MRHLFTKSTAIFALIFALSGAAFTCTAWASSAAQAGEKTDKKILRVRAFGDPNTLDWNRAISWVEGFIIGNLMEGLLTNDSKLRPVPAMAETWATSADHKTYTFKLRKGLKWSDGKPLTSADFVASWKRLLNPETASLYAFFLFDIENAENFNKGELKDFGQVGIKNPDDRTIVVRLKAPVAYWYWMPSYLSTFPIREDLIQKYGPAWTAPENLVTAGPFTLASQDKSTVVLKRNPNYTGKTGNIDEIQISLVYDDAQALKMYEEGKIDLLPKISSLERMKLKGRPDLKTWPDLRVIYLRLNSSRNPTALVSLRRAIAMSIDRTKIAGIYSGAYKPASSFVPPGMLGFAKNAGVAFNPEKAKQELKRAGLNPAILPTLDLLTVAFDDQIILAQFIEDQLKRNLGLHVRIHNLEPKRYYSRELKHSEFALQINFWGADFPDADSFFSIFLSNSGINRYKWKEPEYDRLVTAARSLPDRKAREKAYLQAQKILLEDSAATIPMYYGQVFGLVRDNIRGFDPGALNWASFKDLSILPAK